MDGNSVKFLVLLCFLRNCPIDLKEPIASLIFASPRCADIPELQDVRKQFTKKYGKEFVASALELRPDCGVNHMVSPLFHFFFFFLVMFVIFSSVS